MIFDIGCGDTLVAPTAFGIDGRKFEHTKHLTNDLCTLSKQLPLYVGKVNTVFSSHCLEHIPDDSAAIRDWSEFLSPSGKLILYLPDTRHYDDVSNPEHVHSYTYEVFMRWFAASFPWLKVLEHGPHVAKGVSQFAYEDYYSFYLVAARK